MVTSTGLEGEHSAVLHMKVLNRAHDLPIVKSATTYVTTFYQQAKDYSPLILNTLNMAENGAKLAGQMATPVIRQLDGNINKLDDIALQVLIALEAKYPVISKETDEVSASLLDATAGYRDGAAKQAGALLESTPAQVALMGLAGYLRMANKIADITLAQDETDSDMSFESNNVALMNVAVLSDKLYRRIKRQSLHQLQHLQDVSTKAFSGLHNQLTLLEFAKLNLQKYDVKDQTAKLWQQVQSTSHNLQQQTLVVAGQITEQLVSMYDAAATSAVTERTLQLAQQISSQLQTLYETAATSAYNLPGAVQSALNMSKSYADKLYKQLAQVKSTDDLTTLALSQIRESMTLFQSSASYLFQVASTVPILKHSPLTSLSVDISKAREQIAKTLASGGVAYASESLQSYMRPAQETEMNNM